MAIQEKVTNSLFFVEPTDFYNMVDKQKEIYLKKVKAFIQTNELFKKMENIIKRHVKSYQTDFYIHDLFSLTYDTGDFVWLVRKSGTDLIRTNNQSFTNEGEWYGKLWYQSVIQSTSVEHFYYYNSNRQKLMKISKEKADEIIERFNQYNLTHNKS